MENGNPELFLNQNEVKLLPQYEIKTCLIENTEEPNIDIEKIKSEGYDVHFGPFNFNGVISPITNKSLFSEEYLDCVGVLGSTESEGKNVAFMTHTVGTSLYGQSEAMHQPRVALKRIQEKLAELVSLGKKGTTDIVIFGDGVEKLRDKNLNSIATVEGYENTINFLKDCFENFPELDPIILLGPKNNADEPTNAYFDTENRRLYLTQNNRNDQPDLRLSTFRLSEADEFLKKLRNEYAGK